MSFEIKTRVLSQTDTEEKRIRATHQGTTHTEGYFTRHSNTEGSERHGEVVIKLMGLVDPGTEYTVQYTGETASGYIFRVFETPKK